MTLAVAGTLMQTPAPDRLTVTDAVVEVQAGAITAVHDRSTPGGAAAGRRALASATEQVELAPGTFLLPGLVDLHIHAPQWPQLGTGLDLPLERWLFDYTFPLEARYADAEFAAAVWDDLVPSLLAMGTTTAVYFSSNHLEATTALARACARHGQRALVGRVAMDHPSGTPEWYRDATAASGVDASAASIEVVAAVGSPRVEPIITPRFTPACTDALLEGLGELAEATGVRVQTHCAESDWHCGYALDRFGTTDPAALDRFGLMRPRTVLGPQRPPDRRRDGAGGWTGCGRGPLPAVQRLLRQCRVRSAPGAGRGPRRGAGQRHRRRGPPRPAGRVPGRGHRLPHARGRRRPGSRPRTDPRRARIAHRHRHRLLAGHRWRVPQCSIYRWG